MSKNIKAIILLLLTAIIWGFAFVAQRKGMESLDPMTFNGIRFALGAVFVGLLMKRQPPFIPPRGGGLTSHFELRTSNFTRPPYPPCQGGKSEKQSQRDNEVTSHSSLLISDISLPTSHFPDRTSNFELRTSDFPWLPGIILFVAASLQQIGMVWTTAGNAGFITGLYVVFVPLLGIFIGQKLNMRHAIAVFFSCIGIYLISVKQGLQFNPGDLIVLASAVFWAFHVQVISKYTRRMDSLHLAFSQYAVCSIASLICGLGWIFWKHPQSIIDLSLFSNIYQAAIPIIYGGLFSVGIAYTLQIEGQKRIDPTTSAIILCLEGVFAMLGGWLLLHENVSFRMLVGGFFLLTAMLISTFKDTSLKRIKK